MRGRITSMVGGAALMIGTVAGTAAAVPSDTEITFDGGGWGHAIGMPQWGAQGMAQHGGHGYADILAHWYDATGLRQASQITPAVPQTVRVGINYVLVGGTREYRPFLWQTFSPVNGFVDICAFGESEGSCSLTAQPGESWRFRYFTQDGGLCAVQQNSGSGWVDQKTKPAGGTDSCTTRLYWSDQPTTRVSFPGSDVARTFARGHIELKAPVTVNNETGFHLAAVLDLEEYVYGIAEVPNTWHMEALKAQAVAARTFGAWKARGGVRSDCSCHLVWDTWDQAYRAYHTNPASDLTEGGPNGQRWRDAVDATAGQVVVYPAGSTSIAQTYYSSSTGGATENVSDVWNSNQADFPYLVSKPDPWSALYAPATPTESTTIRWRHARTAGEIVNALAATSSSCSTAPMPGITELLDMRVTDRHVSGSPRTIEITGLINDQITSKTFYARGAACHALIGTWRTRLALRGHHIHTITGFSRADRLAGDDRYETAVAVSKASYPSGADMVYLAVGTNYPDALASGPAVAHDGAPILLVRSDSLPAVTRTELQRLAPTSVRVLGGDAAISPSVIGAVTDALPGVAVSRIAGATRYETAVAISQASFVDGADTVYVATGENFPDGLVAASAAALLDGPLLLVRANDIPAAVHSELTRLSPETIVIVGGATAVSPSVEAALKSYTSTVKRISASDRYAQSAAVSKATFPAGNRVAYIAVGDNFPDALAAGTAFGVDHGPVLLVTTHAVPTSVQTELLRLRPQRIVILGGPVVVSPNVAMQLGGFMG